MMDIRFLSLANQEVATVVRWYDEQEEGLSRGFLDELDRIVRLIRIHPFAAPEIEPGIRRFLFTRFPYSLIYGLDEGTLVVIAIANLHRQPGYWADRIE